MDNIISLPDAAEMTRRFRESRNSDLGNAKNDLQLLPLSESFDRDAFDALLSQAGCKKVRIYYGMSPDSEVHSIIVGVNGADEDMIGTNTVQNDSVDGDIIIELGQRCPPQCPPRSPLNP